MENVNIDLIRGHVDTIILRVLENSDKYGLEILNEIKEMSNDLYSLKQPTLYNCLKRLEKQGYISSYPGSTSNGAQRVYYTLTDIGAAYLESDKKQWEFSRTIMDKLLSDKEFDPETEIKPFDPNEFRPLTKRTREVTEKPVDLNELIPNDKMLLDKDQYAELLSQLNEANNKLIEEQKLRIQKENEALEQAKRNESVTKIDNDKLLDDLFSRIDKYSDKINRSNTESTNITLSEKTEATRIERVEQDVHIDKPYIKPSRAPEYKSIIADTAPTNNEVNYISALGTLFDVENKQTKNVEVANSYSSNHLNDTDVLYEEMNYAKLKNKLYSDHIKLKQYTKSTTIDYYAGKFYYSNKTLRDTSLIWYVFFAAFVLIAHFCTPTAVGLKISWCIAVLCIGLIIPIAACLNYFLVPLKKRRTNFNLSYAMLSGFIFALGCVLIIILITFFSGISDVNKPVTLIAPLFIPLASLLLIPIGIAIYALLYNSKRYHLG